MSILLVGLLLLQLEVQNLRFYVFLCVSPAAEENHHQLQKKADRSASFHTFR